MKIILYNLQGEERDLYIEKLKTIEPTANFLTKIKGNPERAVIDIESCIDEGGHIDDDRFHEIDTLLENAGFYIFSHNDNFKPENGKVIKTREITLKRNLLIVGNGFDIAHGLKTTYIDFLNTYSKNINNHEHNMRSNRIYLYLKEQKNQNGYWTNVEKAITDIIKFLEKIKITLTDNTPYDLKELQALLDEKYYNFIRNFNHILCPLETNKYPFSYKFTNNFFNKFIKKLEYDLDSFINALENYLLGIENTSVDNLIHLNDIDNIKNNITHILSFNYTDTFRKLYINNISDKNIDFIHGKLGKHNLVLGISETLDNEQENLEHSCIYFKKYFQRIFKKTGAKYADWLSNDSGYKFDTAYIYGHSLDITDKEILSRIINDVDHVKKIVIFYHNEAHYRQEISNLVKILDKNIFLKYIAEHRIEFKEQSS